MKRLFTVIVLVCLVATVAAAGNERYVLKLNVYDRLKIAGFLPTRSGIEKAVIALDIKDKIKITQEETQYYAMVSSGNTVQWEQGKGREEVPFEFTYLEMKMLKDGIKEANDKKEVEVTEPYIALYRKISEAEPVVEEKPEEKVEGKE